MKTRCPDCQTVFRVTPEQLKARAGKVRCGHCQSVFNALDSLLDNQAIAAPVPAVVAEPSAGQQPNRVTLAEEKTASSSPYPEIDRDFAADEPAAEEPAPATEVPHDPSETREIGKAAGLILPRDTTEIPGYSKWADGVMTAPLALPADKPLRWPFAVVAGLLTLALAGQIVFHFRAELAVSAPSLRPALEAFSLALGSPLPLPAHIELVTIETSDLQTDPARDNLLVLNATLRNRAPYAQAYPSLELSLTDTQDVAIGRRVFGPADYLPKRIPSDQPFAANSDLAIRLWIDAKELGAAGYRLFVFYP